MKKYIISVAVAVTLIVAGGYGVKSSMSTDSQLSALTKANVEALAWPEIAMKNRIPYSYFEDFEYLDNGCIIRVILHHERCLTGGRDDCVHQTTRSEWCTSHSLQTCRW